MFKTSKGMRLHIGLYGRRNVGKSSLLNAITKQEVSIVSQTAGTTTDPVEKPMELLPLGPVLFIDTAGIDDEGALGSQRVEKTRKALERTDLGLIVTAAGQWGDFERQLLDQLTTLGRQVLVVFNMSDCGSPDPTLLQQLDEQKIPWCQTSCLKGEGLDELRATLITRGSDDRLHPPELLSDLVPSGGMVLLVVPIDLEAPKGRLILPQVQTIRAILDQDSWCCVVKENALQDALDRLKSPPDLVITDSQAFAEVGAIVPEDVPLTGFSVLFARLKGDLPQLVAGTRHIDQLKPGHHVLVCESCTHHPLEDDIGTEKIPRWLEQHVGGMLKFTHVRGHDFPNDLSPYQLVVQCGACMWNRREMLSRIELCRQAGVPISNYGLTIAFTRGIFPRALQPFGL
jgi:[FeFe] hydrogenase H-cluster maturation GTPase HydF